MKANNILRKSLVGLWRLFKKMYYKKNHILLYQGVEFNRDTKLAEFVKINRGSRINGASIDSYSYVGENCVLNKTKIGKFCSIGSDVHIAASNHPTNEFISTSPIFYSSKKQCGITFCDQDNFSEHKTIMEYYAIIGNDVWIGEHVYILGGVKIGDGAIIALGSVVTKDVPSYAIVAGIPARIIRYRFNKETIEQLLTDKWWDKPIEWLKRNYQSFYNQNTYNILFSRREVDK